MIVYDREFDWVVGQFMERKKHEGKVGKEKADFVSKTWNKVTQRHG